MTWMIVGEERERERGFANVCACCWVAQKMKYFRYFSALRRRRLFSSTAKVLLFFDGGHGTVFIDFLWIPSDFFFAVELSWSSHTQYLLHQFFSNVISNQKPFQTEWTAKKWKLLLLTMSEWERNQNHCNRCSHAECANKGEKKTVWGRPTDEKLNRRMNFTQISGIRVPLSWKGRENKRI